MRFQSYSEVEIYPLSLTQELPRLNIEICFENNYWCPMGFAQKPGIMSVCDYSLHYLLFGVPVKVEAYKVKHSAVTCTVIKYTLLQLA